MSDNTEPPKNISESSIEKPSTTDIVQPQTVAPGEIPKPAELVETPTPGASVNGNPDLQAPPKVNELEQPPSDKLPPKSDVVETNHNVQRIQLSHVPSQKIAVELHDPPKSKGFFNGCGRFFRALARDYGVLIATVVIAYYAHTINKQQIESLRVQAAAQQVQSQAAQDDVQVKFIQEFKNHLGELMPANAEALKPEDLRKKKLAAITLAQYGDRALPPLKMSLSVDDRDIREGAAVVVAQMLAESKLRQTVLSKLKEYFDENNTALRIGVLECYLTINTGLTRAEFEDARTKILQYVNPAADYTNKPEEQRVVLWAVKFFSYWPSIATKDFLLTVARNTSYNDQTHEGALNLLPSVIKDAKDITEDQRQAVTDDTIKTLQDLFPHASEHIQKNITGTIESLKTK